VLRAALSGVLGDGTKQGRGSEQNSWRLVLVDEVVDVAGEEAQRCASAAPARTVGSNTVGVGVRCMRQVGPAHRDGQAGRK